MTSGRLYLQYVPDAESLQRLEALQAELQPRTGGRVINAHQVHMTLIHVGVLKEVWGELRRQRPELPLEAVEASMVAFAEEAGALMPDDLEVRAGRLDRFGPHGNVLALRIELDDRLREIHRRCLHILVGRLQVLLGFPPEDFMRRSPNLRYTLDAQPHITLLRNIRHFETDGVALPESLRMTAAPPLQNLRLP